MNTGADLADSIARQLEVNPTKVGMYLNCYTPYYASKGHYHTLLSKAFAEFDGTTIETLLGKYKFDLGAPFSTHKYFVRKQSHVRAAFDAFPSWCDAPFWSFEEKPLSVFVIVVCYCLLLFVCCLVWLFMLYSSMLILSNSCGHRVKMEMFTVFSASY